MKHYLRIHASWLAGSLFLVSSAALSATPVELGVGPQYDTAHVYVTPDDVEKFTDSFIATFGGRKTKAVRLQVTPTPSLATSQVVFSPVGSVSVFGYTTPVPYPFGHERRGYLVKNLDAAITQARQLGAEVIVSAFPDPIGRDALIVWPGGLTTQLYWHTHAPDYERLETVPENRVYMSPDRIEAFLKGYLTFTNGSVVADVDNAPGEEIGLPEKHYRRVRLDSLFGKTTILVTDGHLPFPYGYESTGYEVENLAATLTRARASGAVVLAGPNLTRERFAAIVEFPGGYIAEIHSLRLGN